MAHSQTFAASPTYADVSFAHKKTENELNPPCFLPFFGLKKCAICPKFLSARIATMCIKQMEG